VQGSTGGFVEVQHSINRLIYAVFWTPMNLGEWVESPLQGGGRWFDSSIAHLENSAFCRKNYADPLHVMMAFRREDRFTTS
jgi:hypothetical protein